MCHMSFIYTNRKNYSHFIYPIFNMNLIEYEQEQTREYASISIVSPNFLGKPSHSLISRGYKVLLSSKGKAVEKTILLVSETSV